MKTTAGVFLAAAVSCAFTLVGCGMPVAGVEPSSVTNTVSEQAVDVASSVETQPIAQPAADSIESLALEKLSEYSPSLDEAVAFKGKRGQWYAIAQSEVVDSYATAQEFFPEFPLPQTVGDAVLSEFFPYGAPWAGDPYQVASLHTGGAVDGTMKEGIIPRPSELGSNRYSARYTSQDGMLLLVRIYSNGEMPLGREDFATTEIEGKNYYILENMEYSIGLALPDGKSIWFDSYYLERDKPPFGLLWDEMIPLFADFETLLVQRGSV